MYLSPLNGENMRELNNPDHVLEYIIKDCSEAISANPLAPKTEHYLKLARACQAELIRRQNMRIDRKVLNQETNILRWRQNKPDMVKYALKQGFKSARLTDINQAKWAAINVGLRKLHSC